MPDLELKPDKPENSPVGICEPDNTNPDQTGYAALEFAETKLKFSIRRRVAGFLTLCAAAIMLVYLIHLLVPESWHWLTSAQLDRIESVSVTVFGGLVMSIGTLFYSKK